MNPEDSGSQLTAFKFADQSKKEGRHGRKEGRKQWMNNSKWKNRNSMLNKDIMKPTQFILDYLVNRIKA